MDSMKNDIVEILVKKDERIADLEAENKQLKDMLQEAALQIEYLHTKFQETGSGNSVLSRIKTLLK